MDINNAGQVNDQGSIWNGLFSRIREAGKGGTSFHLIFHLRFYQLVYTNNICEGTRGRLYGTRTDRERFKITLKFNILMIVP